MYLKEIKPFHLSGKNNHGERIDLIKGNDRLWYAYRNGNLPVIAKLSGNATMTEIAKVFA